MRITLELDTADIARFTAAFERVRSATCRIDEVEVIDAAKYALDHLETSTAPAFVRKRLVEVQRLIVMLEDGCWALADPERSDVVETLAYFGDPDDLIPDHIEVVGLLDDAIMLELLLRRLRKVRRAYADFCGFRAALGSDAGIPRRHRIATRANSPNDGQCSMSACATAALLASRCRSRSNVTAGMPPDAQ